jgi:hypothetical protein
MKKIFLLIFAAICIVDLYAQQPATQNCFNEYYTAFRDRGADPVADGVNEVVVCIRKEGNCTCVLGKITVKDGKPINDLMLAKEDGTYEKFNFTPHSLYKTEVTNFENGIFNGMSPTYFSSNDESINLFFIKALKPKKGNYKQAPAIK